MIPDPNDPSKRRRPLTDAEIEARFGTYIDDCLVALTLDLSYITRMAEAGARLHHNRQRRDRKRAEDAERYQRRREERQAARLHGDGDTARAMGNDSGTVP